MKNIKTKVMNREINIDDISEGLISKELYTNKFPGPDLLIWAFGEKRISKFMLWKIFFSDRFFKKKFKRNYNWFL